MPFLVLSHPTAVLLSVGSAVSAVGLLVRGWAAGTVEKDRELATTGPYAHTRNPMYLGSFVIGVGLTLAGGGWLWPAAFVLFFLVVYGPTMSREGRELSERFGSAYREYAADVPAFVPRLVPPRSASAGGFEWERYRRYREWEALLGVGVALIVLALKLRYA